MNQTLHHSSRSLLRRQLAPLYPFRKRFRDSNDGLSTKLSEGLDCLIKIINLNICEQINKLFQIASVCGLQRVKVSFFVFFISNNQDQVIMFEKNSAS